MKSLSRVRPSATPWTAAFQAPPSMGFSRQEYWSGVPLPSPTQNYTDRDINTDTHTHTYKKNTFEEMQQWWNLLIFISLVDCPNTNFLVVISYYSYAKCCHWVNWSKAYIQSPYMFFVTISCESIIISKWFFFLSWTVKTKTLTLRHSIRYLIPVRKIP